MKQPLASLGSAFSRPERHSTNISTSRCRVMEKLKQKTFRLSSREVRKSALPSRKADITKPNDRERGEVSEKTNFPFACNRAYKRIKRVGLICKKPQWSPSLCLTDLCASSGPSNTRLWYNPITPYTFITHYCGHFITLGKYFGGFLKIWSRIYLL